MADRPIIFSAPMVRALLDGRKTQTRRLMPDQKYLAQAYSPIVSGTRIFNYAGEEEISRARYAKRDRLYVRENWRVSPEACEGWHPEHMLGWIDYQAGGSLEVVAPSLDAVERAAFLKGEDRDWDFLPSRYRPCIHMPRWASRLMLTVEDVRVQRLQDISEEDAQAEGVERGVHPITGEPDGWKDYSIIHAGPHKGKRHPHAIAPWKSARLSFQSLWDSLHGVESWNENPFVVAVTFRVEPGNIDSLQT